MPTVTITHPGGGTETISETTGYKYKREIGEMDKLTIGVDRRDAESVTLNRQQDKIELAGVAAGRLVDVEAGGETRTLIVRSFEWDAKKEEPIEGGTRRVGTDEDLLTDLINGVSSWTVNSSVELTPQLTFIFNHAFAHEAMRRIERNVPGELRWNDDQSVDYVESLGTDKSSTVTLSPTAGNLNSSIQIQKQGTELDVTHLRIIGAHEGEAQLVANLVPSGDSGNYASEVTYSNPNWSSPSDTVWGRWENKDVAEQTTIEEEAASIAEELTERHVEATAVVEGANLSLGDYVQVQKPDADLDRRMRIHRITTRTTNDSVAGTVDEVLLSTRTIARGSEQRKLRDIQRYNVAFQGSAVWGTIGAGIQAVNSSVDYQLPFFYPDVNYEHRVELNVKSIPYRAFSSGGASTTLGTYRTEDYRVLDSGETIDTSSSPVEVSAVVPSAPAGGVDDDTTVAVSIGNGQDTSQSYSWEVENIDSSTVLDTGSQSISFGETHTENYSYDLVEAPVGQTLTFRITDGFLGTTSNQADDMGYASITIGATGSHTHPPNPGVTLFQNETVTDSEVFVNDNLTASASLGSGEFEQVVTLSGELDPGAWNTISITSDDTGMLICSLGIEAYRQIGGQ